MQRHRKGNRNENRNKKKKTMAGFTTLFQQQQAVKLYLFQKIKPELVFYKENAFI